MPNVLCGGADVTFPEPVTGMLTWDQFGNSWALALRRGASGVGESLGSVIAV